MSTQAETHLVCDRSYPGVHIVRFTHPDLRRLLDQEPITESTLFKELDRASLSKLGANETLVLNFGLVTWYGSAFHRALMAISDEVKARNAKLLLCCLTPIIREFFDIMGGRTFEVRAAESSAVDEALKNAARR